MGLTPLAGMADATCRNTRSPRVVRVSTVRFLLLLPFFCELLLSLLLLDGLSLFLLSLSSLPLEGTASSFAFPSYESSSELLLLPASSSMSSELSSL